MPRPRSELLPGDTFQCIPDSTFGEVIDFGEGHGKQPCHTEGYIGGGWVWKMNPPRSVLYPLDKVDWERTFVYRLDLSALNLPACPGSDPRFVENLRRIASRDLNSPYGYGQIADYMGLSPFSWMSPQVASWIQRNLPGPATLFQRVIPGQHKARVCSTAWAKYLLQKAARVTYDRPGLQLFPAIGDGDPRPSDVTPSPYLFPVA